MSIAFWCLLAAGILPQLAGFYAKADKNFDNNNARDWLARQEGEKARAVAAMNNGYEGLPLFIAAVLVAHLQGVDAAWLDGLALTYVLLRIPFTICYIKGWGTLRSLVWVGGLACIITLFVKAA